MVDDKIELIDELNTCHSLSHTQWTELVTNPTESERQYAADIARKLTLEKYGNNIYIRGLIEISNYCRNNCMYCGIRRDNIEAERYRLNEDIIIDCAMKGYELGFRTFVLQGGEDSYYNDERIINIINSIKSCHDDVAVTLSLGERSYDSYKRLYDAGADRYLLRNETGDVNHYNMLHPSDMSYENRIECLHMLKEIGYQVGCGFMVGSPGQKAEYLAKDMKFIEEFEPHMVGIGPFIPHHQTPYAGEPSGTLEQTLYLLSLIRILNPNILLPATTALGTIHPQGREMGIMAGANVVMPNLSPVNVRELYTLYDNKICMGDEAAECIKCLSNRVESIGYTISIDRGDAIGYRKK